MPEKQSVLPKCIPKIYGLGSSQVLAQEMCKFLGVNIEKITAEQFPDGEVKIKPVNPVGDQDVVIFHSLVFEPEQSPNEKICELLMFASLLKDEGARNITALLPYFAYSRSDQKKEFQDPLTLKYLARLYEAAGITKIITLDIHNLAAFQNAFRCPSLNLEATSLFCDFIKAKNFSQDSLVVMSPDLGGIKRAEKFRHHLQLVLARPVSLAILEKYREKEGLQGQTLVGNVGEAHVLIYDDMISTGKTVLRAAEVVRKKGALSLRVIASHGLFSENRAELLQSPLIDEFIVTDSNPTLLTAQFRDFQKLKILSSVAILAQGFGLDVIS